MLLNNLFLVGTFPAHVHSVGDHAQTLAVTRLLKKQFPDYKLQIFNRDLVQEFFDAKNTSEVSQ